MPIFIKGNAMKKSWFLLLAIMASTSGYTAITDTDYDQKPCADITLPEHFIFAQTQDCEFVSGLAPIQNTQNSKYGFVNHLGQVVVEPVFEEAWAYENNYAPVKIDGKWGFVDTSSKIAVKPAFDDVWGFSEGLARIFVDDKFGFIDETGKIVIKPIYDDSTGWFKDGVATVSKTVKGETRWGLIDKTGKTVIDFKYDALNIPSDGLLRAIKGTDDDLLYGFIDKKGKTVIDFKYSTASDFSSGTAVVTDDNGDTKLIDTAGNIVKTKLNFGL